MKKFSKIIVLLCVLSCVFALTSCGSKKVKPDFDYTESEMVAQVTQETETITGWNDDTIDSYIKQFENTTDDDSAKTYAAGLNQYKTCKEEAGTYEGFYLDKDGNAKYSISTSKDSVTIVAKAKFTKRDVKITYVFGEENNQILPTSFTYEAQYSLGEKMEKAALNTVMGLGTVAVVLFMLSLLISLFKYVGKIEKSINDRKNGVKANQSQKQAAVDNTIGQIVEKEEIEETSDSELVAVIASAISASANIPTDGFVVRSVKRVSGNRNSWRR